jgi:acyl dehydratase
VDPKQLCFEELEVGTDIPALVKEQITTIDLVKWAVATDDFNPVHFDKDYALEHGLPSVIVHGPLKCALLTRLIFEWAGEKGILRKLTCTHRAMSYPRETLLCRGKVSKKYIEDGQNLVECEIWVENQDGAISASGRAIVVLP